MFIRKQGKTKTMHLPVAASAGAMAAGSLVAFSSGTLVLATNTVESYYIIGVLKKEVTIADADYATARLLPVEVPVEKNVVWEADVNVGTLATSSVGLYFDLDTADTGKGIDQSASALDIALCTKYISASKGWFILNMGVEGKVKA